MAKLERCKTCEDINQYNNYLRKKSKWEPCEDFSDVYNEGDTYDCTNCKYYYITDKVKQKRKRKKKTQGGRGMIDTTYEMGQKVWFVNFEEKEYKCPVCHGEGITEANVAKKIYTVKCPECCGWKHLWKKTYTVKAVKIEGIEVQVLSKTSWIATYKLSNDEYLFEKLKDGQKLFHTAVDQSKVFASRKEALAYAKTANKKAKADKEEEKKNDAKRDLAEQEIMYA